MSMSIGELSQRLRITTRTARHYDDLGLLVPADVDGRTGYRTYGEAQLVRGMQIEQLKTTGLSLAGIKALLDSHGEIDDALRRRRRFVEAAMTGHAAQLAAIDALVNSTRQLAVPELVQVPLQHVVVMRRTSTLDGLGRTIRRAIQQLNRDTRRREGVRCRSFSARFPLNVDDDSIDVEIAGHLDAPIEGSTIRPTETQLRVELVGHIGLLPMAYDVVLTAATERGLQLCGTVVEHYRDLGAVGRTDVAVPVECRTEVTRPGLPVRCSTA